MMTVTQEKNAHFLSSFAPYVSREADHDVLRRYRLEAWKKLELAGLPESRNDAFQYVQLNSILDTKYTIPGVEAAARFPIIESHKSCIVFINGVLRLDLSSLGNLPKGCVIKSFHDAVKTYAALFNNSFSNALQHERDPFALLTMSCYQSGLFIYIPPKVVLNHPIEIIHVLEPGVDRCIMPRVLMFMGAQAEASVFVSTDVKNAENMFASMLLETHLDDNAILKVTETFLDAGTGMVFNSLRSRVARNGVFSSMQLAHGKIPVRFDTKVTLAGSGAETNLAGLWITSGDEECHTNVFIEHLAPHTRSNQLFKGVLFDHSRSSFQGKIYVHREAQKTLAYQLNNNLVLSDDAQANSKPNLEIFADDVKASHGATVGQLDQDQVFYLKTRGFSEKEAKSALIKGFCMEAIERIDIASLKETVANMITSIIA